jgi:hypothetical protein
MTPARLLTPVRLQVTLAGVKSNGTLCKAALKLLVRLEVEWVRVPFKTQWQVRSPHMFACARSHGCAALIPHAPVPPSPAVVSTSAGATVRAAHTDCGACSGSGTKKAACSRRAHRGVLLRGRWPRWPQPRRRRTLPRVHDSCWRR